MRDVVEQILSAEGEAKARIQKARESASAIRTQADREAEQRLQEARTQAQDTIRSAVTGAREQGEREHGALVEQAHRESKQFIESHTADIEKTIAKAVERIIKPEYAED
jgi:V/A-type H+-transporting ATPase subunit G/H